MEEDDIEVSTAEGADGPVVFIDTPGVPEGPDGPLLRIRLNDHLIWDGAAGGLVLDDEQR